MALSGSSQGFPGGSARNESSCNAGDPGLIPGLGRSPGGVHGNPLQYSCLENPTDRGAWWAIVHGATLKLQSDANIFFFYQLPAHFPELFPPHRFPSFWTVLPFLLPFLMKAYFPTCFFFYLYIFQPDTKSTACLFLSKADNFELQYNRHKLSSAKLHDMRVMN